MNWYPYSEKSDAAKHLIGKADKAKVKICCCEIAGRGHRNRSIHQNYVIIIDLFFFVVNSLGKYICKNSNETGYLLST